MTKGKLKYYDDVVFKKDTYDALSSQFKDNNEFESFYSSLKNDQIKDDFLRVGSAYLFFVKSGDWQVNIERSNPKIEYITNSFKLVSTLSIIEGLNNKKHIDFFQWLNQKENLHLFPIRNDVELQIHHIKYKAEYGSINNIKDFFNNLSTQTKNNLCELVTINNKKIETIEKLINLIYQARSNFAHSTTFTLEFGNHTHYGGTKNKRIVWHKFEFEYILAAVEEGIIAHFTKLNNAPQEPNKGHKA